MVRFVIATMCLAALLLAACVSGGYWAYAALGYVTVFVAVMDRLPVAPAAPREGETADRFARGLTSALAGLHFVLLPIGIVAVTRDVARDWPSALALTMALGLFAGQVAHPVAHELIHAGARWRRRLGAAIYVSVLFGHHASAHLKVHHVHVATPADPNTAQAGEGFFRFWPRAWLGSFAAGWAAEKAALARAGQRIWRHPYVVYLAGGVFCAIVAGALAGWPGVAVFLVISAYAQMQILLADYVQHYGLKRTRTSGGKLRPVGPEHSWNAPQWFSAALMLNATRHSDHHLHPQRLFPALHLTPETMPVLPRPLPVMAVIALLPPVWRRVMDPRVRAWRQV